MSHKEALFGGALTIGCALALAWYAAAFGTGARSAPASAPAAAPATPAPPPPPIRVPTLYVWSTEDSAFGREAAEATAQYVGGPYRFEVIEGVGHWLLEAAAERVSELILQHIRE